jgi:antirestriction protein ArdC
MSRYSRKWNKNRVATDRYAEITDRIVDALENGEVLPWVRPWRSAGPLRNAFTGHVYRGINTLLLGMMPYSDPRWATYNQITKAGGDLRGQKGVQIVMWKFYKKEDPDTGKEKTIPFMKYFTVFNVEQATGLELPALDIAPLAEDRNEEWDNFIEETGARVEYGADGACYQPLHDVVEMPEFSSFKSVDGFYATIFHELGHWTGAESRLDRDGIARFDNHGSEQYAFEELVAELTSAFIGRDLGYDSETSENTKSYLKSWIRILKNDKHAIFRAARQAEAAAKLILGKEIEGGKE